MRGGSAWAAQCNQAESPSETVTLLGLYSLEPVERNCYIFFFCSNHSSGFERQDAKHMSP